jgi:hypothetical protein
MYFAVYKIRLLYVFAYPQLIMAAGHQEVLFSSSKVCKTVL